MVYNNIDTYSNIKTVNIINGLFIQLSIKYIPKQMRIGDRVTVTQSLASTN